MTVDLQIATSPLFHSRLRGLSACGAFLLLLIAFLVPSDAYACSCAQTPELEQALKEASVVFVGRVTEQRPTPFRKGYSEVKMTVFKKFKGFDELPNDQQVLIYTADSDAACRFNFQNGYEYLVFADGSPAFLTVSKCSRSELLDKAMLDQQRLIRMVPKAAE